jgi:hypothetical protein
MAMRAVNSAQPRFYGVFLGFKDWDAEGLIKDKVLAQANQFSNFLYAEKAIENRHWRACRRCFLFHLL